MRDGCKLDRCRPPPFIDQVKSFVPAGDLHRVESLTVIVVHRINHIRMPGQIQAQHAETPGQVYFHTNQFLVEIIIAEFVI